MKPTIQIARVVHDEATGEWQLRDTSDDRVIVTALDREAAMAAAEDYGYQVDGEPATLANLRVLMVMADGEIARAIVVSEDEAAEAEAALRDTIAPGLRILNLVPDALATVLAELRTV